MEFVDFVATWFMNVGRNTIAPGTRWYIRVVNFGFLSMCAFTLLCTTWCTFKLWRRSLDPTYRLANKLVVGNANCPGDTDGRSPVFDFPAIVFVDGKFLVYPSRKLALAAAGYKPERLVEWVKWRTEGVTTLPGRPDVWIVRGWKRTHETKEAAVEWALGDDFGREATASDFTLMSLAAAELLEAEAS